jgi:phenylpropionate dioxygenase-like ring-hydroxylating dioxygenase large terminal subunit
LLFAAETQSQSQSKSQSKSKSKSISMSKNQEALSKRKFPRTWVPLASVYELDPNRPTPLQFLDQDFVTYKQTVDLEDGVGSDDGNDDWIVMDNHCPHRLVPLSEGRINRNSTAGGTATATLQCSYHGWEFDGSSSGTCVKIPQASRSVEAIALASPRARVQTYSVRIHKNILWFWPWADVDALSLLPGYPRGYPEGIMAGISNTERTTVSKPTTYTRDLPYGWDTLLENLIDPAHIPFAHHKLQGTRDDAVPITMTVPESLGEFQYDGYDDDTTTTTSPTTTTTTTASIGNTNNGNANNDDANASANKRSGEAGFFFEWQDRTREYSPSSHGSDPVAHSASGVV